MKILKRKSGFTIVELVIVIAIIAILAAVLIPTFSNVIGKADEAACLQEAKSKFSELYALDYADGKIDGMQNNESFVDSSYKVTLTGYDMCIYQTDSNKLTKFEYKNKKKNATLTVSYDSNEWSVD